MSTITVTFDPPTPADSPSAFNTKAFATLGDLNTWSTQANTVAGEVNTNASTASTAATTATTQAGTATSAASSATTSASTATTQAGNASSSASAAAISESNAATSATAAAAATSSKYDKTGGPISGNVAVAGDLSVSGSGGITNTYTTAAYSFGPSSTEQIYRSGNTLRFYVNSADVANIDASGNLLVGTASSSGLTKMIAVNDSTSSSAGVVYQAAGTAKGYTYLSGTSAMKVESVSGTTIQCISATAGVSLANGATSWAAISDETLKDVIEPISNALASVVSWRKVIGKYKADAEGTRRQFLIAQDVQETTPESIDTDAGGILSLRYADTIPTLAAATEELNAKVDSQAEAIAALIARIEALEARA